MNLPFEFTNKSILDWLTELQALDAFTMSNEVYKVLSALRKEYEILATPALVITLMRITPAVIELSTLLEALIVAYAKEAKGRKLSKVNIRILYHLAFLHTELAKRSEQPNDRVLHLNYALQVIGLVSKACALSYDRLPDGLYQCASKCYEIAYFDGILDTPIEGEVIADLQYLYTISLALKRWLLFYVINPYQFSQQDIVTVFDFCTEHSNKVNFIKPDSAVDPMFCWDYKNVYSHCPIFPSPDFLPEKAVLFNTNALVHFDNQDNLNIADSRLLITLFDQYKRILEHSQLLHSSAYVVVGGFFPMCEFFNKHIYQGRIVALNSPSPDTLNFSNVMSLGENSATDSVETLDSTDIWNPQQEKRKQKLEFAAMKLVKSDQASLFITEIVPIKLFVGDIFICYSDNLNIILGITRAIRGGKGAIQRAVVELCLGSVSLLHQVNNTADDSFAFLLKTTSGYELFLEPMQYRLQSKLVFEQADVILEQLLETSTEFVRYAVSVRESPKPTEEEGLTELPKDK